MVDSFTASAISQIYDKVNDANKKKMEKLPIIKLANLAMKMMQKNDYVPEEVDLEEKKETAQYTDGGSEKITVTVDNMRKVNIDNVITKNLRPGWKKVEKKSGGNLECMMCN